MIDFKDHRFEKDLILTYSGPRFPDSYLTRMFHKPAESGLELAGDGGAGYQRVPFGGNRGNFAGH